MAEGEATCACGEAATHRCETCGARLCDDHAAGPWRPRPSHFRVRSFGDLLRDYPIERGLDDGQMWTLRAEVARACPPGVRCIGCWENAFDEALAAAAPAPLPALVPEEVTGDGRARDGSVVAVQGKADEPGGVPPATVTSAELLAAWRSTGKPRPIEADDVGRSRFRAARGWRIGTRYADRMVRDGEGTVRVQLGPVYLLADGEVWTRGAPLPAESGFPADWLPAGWLPSGRLPAGRRPAGSRLERASGSEPTSVGEPADPGAARPGSDSAQDRASALLAARARAEEVMREHGWP